MGMGSRWGMLLSPPPHIPFPGRECFLQASRDTFRRGDWGSPPSPAGQSRHVATGGAPAGRGVPPFAPRVERAGAGRGPERAAPPSRGSYGHRPPGGAVPPPGGVAVPAAGLPCLQPRGVLP